MTSELKSGGVVGGTEPKETTLSPEQQYQTIRSRLVAVLRGRGLDPELPTEGEIKTKWAGNSGTTYSVSTEIPSPGRLKFIAGDQGQTWFFSCNSGNHVTGDFLQYFLWENNPKDPQKPLLAVYDTWNSTFSETLRSLAHEHRLKANLSKVNVFEKFDALLQDLSPQQQ